MAVTLRDVAVRAGVSTRTVSNVVNDYEHVSPAMRQRVQVAIDQLGYRPNLLARSLRNGRTGVISLLVPQIAAPYFGELAHEIVERASELGFTVLIDETSGDPVRELALLTVAAHSSRVDGVLLSSLGLEQRDLGDLRSNVPVVLLGERTAPNVDHVGIDNVQASAHAVKHLIEGGRRRIAAIGGNRTGSDMTSRLRLAGYRSAISAAGLPLDDELCARTADYERGSAAAAVRALFALQNPPDALFCFSDGLAMGALRQLHEQGVQVPSVVSVIGFDDVQESRFTVPSLTSIAPDKTNLARTALGLLIERINGSTVAARDVRVPWRLVVRESSVR